MSVNEQSVFAEALEIQDPEALAAFLDRACAGKAGRHARSKGNRRCLGGSGAAWCGECRRSQRRGLVPGYRISTAGSESRTGRSAGPESGYLGTPKRRFLEHAGRGLLSCRAVARYGSCAKQSMQLRSGGDSADWFFLAMAHWQLCEPEKARAWYDRAVQWLDNNKPYDEELRRVRVEAAALLGIPEKPASKPSEISKRPSGEKATTP